MDWCRTCGHETPEGVSECDVCKQWWKDNQPEDTDVEHFNKLTPAALERLAYLGEELAEAGQIIGKILRHGYESYDPTKIERVGEHQTPFYPPINRELLENELADVLRAVKRMVEAGDLEQWRIDNRVERPFTNKYFHHQPTGDLQKSA